MAVVRNLLWIAFVLSLIMIYLTYTPSDSTYFWIYWASVSVFFGFGYLMDILFGAQLTFVFDPNYDNWKRKVDPLS